MSAARKRLRVWVNVYGGNRVGSASDSAKNAREVFVGRSEAGDRESVPFTEMARGDVVVSRDQRQTLATVVKWMDDAPPGQFKVIVEPELRALLRWPVTDPLPYTPEELKTLRNGSQYQTRQNARWFATLEEMREGQRAWQAQSDANGLAMLDMCSLRFFESEERAEKAESERDDLKRQFAEVCRAEALHVQQLAELLDANTKVGAERDALRAQVKAAQAWAKRNAGPLEEGDRFSQGYCNAVSNLLTAMDGAKP